MKGWNNLTIVFDNVSISCRYNLFREKVRWFEKLINLNHLNFSSNFFKIWLKSFPRKISCLSCTHSCWVSKSPHLESLIQLLQKEENISMKSYQYLNPTIKHAYNFVQNFICLCFQAKNVLWTLEMLLELFFDFLSQ